LIFFEGIVTRCRLRVWIAIQLHKTIAFLSSNAKVERDICQERENVLEATMTISLRTESYLDNVTTLTVFFGFII